MLASSIQSSLNRSILRYPQIVVWGLALGCIAPDYQDRSTDTDTDDTDDPADAARPPRPNRFPAEHRLDLPYDHGYDFTTVSERPVAASVAWHERRYGLLCYSTNPGFGSDHECIRIDDDGDPGYEGWQNVCSPSCQETYVLSRPTVFHTGTSRVVSHNTFPDKIVWQRLTTPVGDRIEERGNTFEVWSARVDDALDAEAVAVTFSSRLYGLGAKPAGMRGRGETYTMTLFDERLDIPEGELTLSATSDVYRWNDIVLVVDAPIDFASGVRRPTIEVRAFNEDAEEIMPGEWCGTIDVGEHVENSIYPIALLPDDQAIGIVVLDERGNAEVHSCGLGGSYLGATKMNDRLNETMIRSQGVETAWFPRVRDGWIASNANGTFYLITEDYWVYDSAPGGTIPDGGTIAPVMLMPDGQRALWYFNGERRGFMRSVLFE